MATKAPAVDAPPNRRTTTDPGTPPEGAGEGWRGKLAAIKGKLEQYALFRIAASTLEGFRKDKVPENAAAMTYYGIFSLFPLILLFLSIAGLVLGNDEETRRRIMDIVAGTLPQGQAQIRGIIADVIDARGTAAGIGIVALLWGALGWFQIIDSNINEIWGVSKPRSFLKSKLFALAVVASIGGVAVASFAATAAVHLLEAWTAAIPGSVLVWQLAISGVTFLAIAAIFYVLYRYAPQRDLQATDVWPAALFTAAAWEATRQLVALYVERTDMISGYGPVGAAMALLLWIYVASIIILVGAELSYAIAKERRHIPVEHELDVVSPPGEQPTPKFAPQTGEGYAAGQDEPEPVTAGAGGGSNTPPPERRPAAPPERQPVSVLDWQHVGKQHATPSGNRDGRPRAVYLDVPVVALLAGCVGFVLGRLNRNTPPS